MGNRIYLNNKQGALILDKNGVHSLHLPNMKDDENVPNWVIVLTTIAILLKSGDERFWRYVIRRFDEETKNVKLFE